MGYVKIKVIEKGDVEDLQRWKEHMLEKPQCWNKFCLGCYNQEELHAVRVMKGDDSTNTYTTTLCSDCIGLKANHDILVNENHLMVVL